ncbi:hypothetical protein QVD17_31892 [Tagetes erecta]|uniref:Reverse transcriptase zinc-binding domain-containing protein n=1 Tax=Tagetes erecta TaxID=13708 RepID=A0AAD8NP01_TARER|nr:hypothetical protein QVD17_31892 [Tagetes erecta]
MSTSWTPLPVRLSHGGVWRNIYKIGGDLLSLGVDLNNLIVGVLGNGREIRFWVDKWLTAKPLMLEYPALFALEQRKGILVSDCCELIDVGVAWVWRWKRNILTAQEKEDLKLLTAGLQSVVPNNVLDTWKWEDGSQNLFSSWSIKQLLHSSSNGDGYILNWNGWAPISVNIFMWQALHNKVPTCDSLARRGVALQTRIKGSVLSIVVNKLWQNSF